MTVSHVWLFRRNTAAWHSSLLSHALLQWNDSIWGVNNSKVIAEAFIYPYPITGLYIGTVAFTFHKTAATVGLETKPTLAATRNETGRNNYQTLPIVIRTEHWTIFAQQNRPLSRRLDRCDRVIQNESRDPFGGNAYYVTMQITFLTRNFRNGERNLHCDVVHITTKWVSSLTLDCNGVFAIKAYCKRWRHGQLEQIARMNRKSYDRRSSTANQRNSSGRFRGHPT